MKTFDIPKSVEMFGKSWALLFSMTHPKWHHADQEHDEWNSHAGYDLNLYAGDGQMSVTVYPLIDDGTGFMTTDTSTFKTIVNKQVRS
jgi:hypothetical protein